MACIKETFNQFGNFVGQTEQKLGNDMSSVVYVLISTTTNVLMMAWSKIHVDDITPVQTQYFRGILITPLIYLYSSYYNISLAVPNRTQDNLRIARNVIASLFNVLSFFIITKIPMSTALIIQTSCPFMVAFIDHMINKTTYTKVEIIFSFVSVLGVLFMIKPDLFFDIEIRSQASYGYSEGLERIIWITLFLIGVMFYSVSIILVKSLKGMHPMAMNFPFGITMATSSTLLEIEYEQLKSPPAWVYLQALIFLGLVTFINQHAFVKANQMGKPGKISMLSNLSVVWSFLFELFYLQEQREWYSFVGAALVVGSSVALSISRLK